MTSSAFSDVLTASYLAKVSSTEPINKKYVNLLTDHVIFLRVEKKNIKQGGKKYYIYIDSHRNY